MRLTFCILPAVLALVHLGLAHPPPSEEDDFEDQRFDRRPWDEFDDYPRDRSWPGHRDPSISNLWYRTVDRLCTFYLSGETGWQSEDEEVKTMMTEQCGKFKEDDPRFSPSFEMMQFLFAHPDLSEQLEMLASRY